MKCRLYRCLTAAVLTMVLLLCAACGAKEPTVPENPEPPMAEQVQPEQTPPKQETLPAPEQTEPEETPPTPAFSFADVADLEFYFSSGAGAWRTVLYIHADGTFDGEYLDSDMGDLDEVAYPNGTRYYNAFSGRFTQPEQVDATTYCMQISELTCEYPLGEEIMDGFRWVYSEPYGICGAEDVYIYLPGAKLADLPEGYRSWVGYYDLTQTEETELPFYGLYNKAEQNGFSSSVLPPATERAQAELAWAEATAVELETALQNAQTQMDMNVISGDLYKVWDAALNALWQLLQSELDEETMQQLTAEQLDWIAEKETAAAAAGAAYEGGSMQSMAISLEAAELTRQRVYELVEYFQ